VQQEEQVVLSAGQTAVVTTEILAPPAAYTSEVEVEYPPA
jgi:hypothetical protein